MINLLFFEPSNTSYEFNETEITTVLPDVDLCINANSKIEILKRKFSLCSPSF